MGHVVNPISFRLINTKFCFNTWVSASKLRYSPLFLNDLSLNKFIQWYLSTFNGVLLRSNLLLNNFKIIRLNKNVLININFVEMLEYRKKRRRRYIKKMWNNFLTKNKFSKNTKAMRKDFHAKDNFKTNAKLMRNRFRIKNKFSKNTKAMRKDFHAKNKFTIKYDEITKLPVWFFYLRVKKQFLFKKYMHKITALVLKNKFKKKARALKFRKLKKFVLKNKFKKKARALKFRKLKKFVLKHNYKKKRFSLDKQFYFKQRRGVKRYNFLFLYKKRRAVSKLYHLKIYRNWQRRFFFQKKKKNRVLILFLKFFKFKLNKILQCFLNFVSGKFHINIQVLKRIYYANILSKFIQTKLNQGFLLKYLIRNLNYKLNSRYNNIIGYKLYYSGRSSKKLRNFPEMKAKGHLALSNPRVPLEYSQIALWTKKGIVGLKIWLLKKMKITNVF